MTKNKGINHKSGNKYANEMSLHKKWVEKDFPIAVSKFRIGVLKNAITIEKCLDSLKRADERIKKVLNKLK